MKKQAVTGLLFICIGALSYAQQPVKSSVVQGYRIKLLSLDYFDYSKRFQGRQTLANEGEILCLRGTVYFETMLNNIPVSVDPTCRISEAVTNKGKSLVIEEEQQDEFKENLANIGKLLFYIDVPGKKDTMLTSLKGKAVFKIPVRKNEVKIDTIYTCHWFTIFGGKATVIICEEDQANPVYVVLKFSKKNARASKRLRLYLYDIEAEEKNIFWHYTTYTDSSGDIIKVYKANFFFENKENMYLTINGKDYQITKIIGPPFPKTKNINVFNIKNRKGSKHSKQLYMITLPESRPQKYNWALLNFGEKRNRFSKKKHKGSALEKKLIVFKEFAGIPNFYDVKYMSLFQAEKFVKKAVPFTFKYIPLESSEP